MYAVYELTRFKLEIFEGLSIIILLLNIAHSEVIKIIILQP